ncbi:MAG: KEOPS complex subunit Cgi121 [Methanomassiliicoccus sp.]|nr:KEOPS complex subunit Cgi121 [Methanomassiliicoccus sp.]
MPAEMAKVDVVGAKGSVNDPEALIAALRSIEGGEGAALDADMVCGRDHLCSAAMHALRAFDRGDRISSSLAVETVLFASGERQISKAFKKVGLRAGAERVALVFFDVNDVEAALRSLGLVRDDNVLAPSVEKAKRFGITGSELGAVPAGKYQELVLERVAFAGLPK